MPSKSKPSPRVVIFAGPNGAGKSTHADAILAALGMMCPAMWSSAVLGVA
jgi:ABC-type Mn2+/Zn2+ transport system ATPase subunit